MDKQVVSNALGGVDAILSKAKRALREMIYEQFGGGDDLGSYESPVDAMAYHFDQLYDHLLIVLEAAEMPEARADLIGKWVDKGSREWTRFYVVIYQAHPFLPKSHMKSDMKRVGALTWTPVLLNGRTTPKTKKRRSTKPAASKKAAKRLPGK
jgi:hypothetical protein